MLNEIETRILKKIDENKIITKMEIKTFLQNNDGKISNEALDSITRNLVDKKYIVQINPVGSTCFAVTQRGSKFLHDME